jgi:hypothetical protein
MGKKTLIRAHLAEWIGTWRLSIETDPFIMWAWDPGVRANGKARTTPPLATHDEFLSTVKAWIDAGTPCPAQ